MSRRMQGTVVGQDYPTRKGRLDVIIGCPSDLSGWKEEDKRTQPDQVQGASDRSVHCKRTYSAGLPVPYSPGYAVGIRAIID